MSKRIHKTDTIDWKVVWNPKNLLLIFLGTGLAVLAMKGFMIPNRFMDGGVTGISILLHELFHINISILRLHPEKTSTQTFYMGHTILCKGFPVY